MSQNTFFGSVGICIMHPYICTLIKNKGAKNENQAAFEGLIL